MFNSQPHSASRLGFAGMYHSVGASSAVDGASPHKLVSMLYEAVASEIAAARGALQRSDVLEKCRAIGHSVRIIEEGLIAPLDLSAGGTIASTLRDLYQYMVYRLTMANLHSDDAALADCASLAKTLGESWDAIAPHAALQSRTAA